MTNSNDLDASFSERSPSTAAESVRLDLPAIRDAVAAALAAWAPRAQAAPIPLANVAPKRRARRSIT